MDPSGLGTADGPAGWRTAFGPVGWGIVAVLAAG